MRKAVIAIVTIAALLGGRAVWRSPTASLVSLKLALDRRDLSGVERVLDYRALTDAALARLVDGRPEEPADVRLVLRGENAWVPAVSSARAYLRMRLERSVAQLVEDPAHALDVSWEDLRRAAATLRRTGSVARFRVAGRHGEEYVMRMRQYDGRWRIVAVDRDGEPVLLGAGEREPLPAAAGADDRDVHAAAPEADIAVAAGPDGGIAEAHMAALIDESSASARETPRPRAPLRKWSPFLRRLDDQTWTVQIASTVDAVEADLEREWFESIGEPAFVSEAEVRGQIWRRILVGRYPTRTEAAETLTRLADRDAATARR
jgi:hypothetical protein